MRAGGHSANRKRPFAQPHRTAASLIGHLGQDLFCCPFTWDHCLSSGSRFSSQSDLAHEGSGQLHACVRLAVERPASSRGQFSAAADVFGVFHGPRPVRTIPSWSFGDCHEPQTDLIAAGGLFHAPVQLAVGFVKHRMGIEQRQKRTRQISWGRVAALGRSRVRLPQFMARSLAALPPLSPLRTTAA